MPRITRDHAYLLDAIHHAHGCPDDALMLRQEESTNSSHNSSESTFYITARSAFSEPSEEHAQQTILQVLDTESGIVFDKVCQVMSNIARVMPLHRAQSIDRDPRVPSKVDNSHLAFWTDNMRSPFNPSPCAFAGT